MSISSVRNASRFLTRVFRAVTPRSATALITAGLITACGSDLVEPGVATSVTITTPTGSVTATFNAIGDFIQLTFSATDADGNTVDKTPTWSSSNAAVATVTPTGVVTAVGNGMATISAEVDGVTGQIAVDVAQVPSAIVVTPGTNTLTALGATVQLAAVVQDANANPVTGAAVTWTTSDAAVATVSATGVVAAVTNGTASITATSGALTANAAVTVAQVVSSVTVTPPSAALGAVGATTQLTASAEDANGNPVQGATITWASSNTNAATVSATGLVTAVADGGANITATSNTMSGSAAITVAQTVSTLTVTPAGPLSLSPTDTQQLTAAATDANGNAVASATVTWTSSNQAAVTVTQDGLITAIAQGTAQISATSGGVTTNVDVQVLGPNTVVITPAGPQTLNAIAATVQLTAEALDANGNPVAGQTFSWSSSNANVATVSATGLVTAVANAPGSPVTITATTAGVSATTQVTINQQATSVTVTSGGQTVLNALGQTLQLTVNAPDANGNQVTPFSCASNNTNAITVDASCVVTATANGAATITATAGGMTGTIALTVAQVPTVINISPQVLPLVSINQTGTLTAQLLDERGNVVQGVDVSWSSLSPAIASVVEITPETTPSTATVTALANGNATIEASTTTPALAATATVVVGQVVDPTMSVATVPGGTAGVATQITIQGNDANGSPIPTGGAAVTLNVTGANTQTGISAQDNNDGTYTASYTPTAAGTDMVEIIMDPDGAGPLGSLPILNSPYTSVVAPAIAAAANSTAPTPFPGGVSGVATQFVVTLIDGFNNPVGTDAASTSAVVTGTVTSGPNAGATVSGAATIPADGTWTLSYTPLMTGTDVISISLDPDGPGGAAPAAAIATATANPSPFNSLVGPAIAAPAQTTAAVGGGVSNVQSNVIVTLRDANNNPVFNDAASAGVLVAGSVTGANTAGMTPVNNNDGTWTLSYTPVNAGNDNIAITLDVDGAGGSAPVAIGGSPYVSAVTPSGPSAANSTVNIAKNFSATAGVPLQVTVSSFDSQGNALTVGGAAVLFSINSGPNMTNPVLDPDGAGGVAAGFQNVVANDNNDGTYSMTYTPTAANGVDRISILLNGSPVGPATPPGAGLFDGTVAPAIASPGNTLAPTGPGVSGVTTQVLVTLRDIFNNPVGTDQASASAVITGAVTGVNNVALTAVNNNNGTWTVSYTPVAVGADQLTINLDPDGVSGPTQIAGSPFGSNVTPGLATAANSLANVPAGVAGVQTNILVTLQDVNNNPVGTDPLSLPVVVAGAITGGATTPGPLNAVNNNNGTWTLSYTPMAVAGQPDIIAITLDDGAGGGPVAIAGSPFSSSLTPGPATPTQTTANVPGGTAGQQTNILVTLNDASGNPVGTDPQSAGMLVAGNVVGGPNLGALAPTNNGDGTWTLSYTPTLVAGGPDLIQITLTDNNGNNPVPIAGSNFSSVVAPGPISAANVVPVVPANGQAGNLSTIVIQGKDAFNNNVNVGGANVVVTVGGANAAIGQITVIDSATAGGTPGVYTASYTPVTSGNDAINISVNGTNVPNTPFASAIAPGPVSAANSVAIVPPTGIAGVPFTLVVQARDAFGNATTGGEVLAVNATGANTAALATTDSSLTAPAGTAGTHTATYTPTNVVAGIDTYAITIGGVAIGGGPYTSNVEAAPAPTTSTVGATPGTVVSAGTQVTITLTARDLAGNTTTQGGATVTMVVAGANAAAGALTVVDVGNGQYTGQYTPTVSGQDNITISLDNGLGGGPVPVVNGNPFVEQVNALPAVSLQFQQQPASPTVAGANFAPAITVQGLDNFGNVDPTFAGQVTLAVTTGQQVFGAPQVNAVGGTATFAGVNIQLANGEPGTPAQYTLTATSGVLTQDVSNPFTIDPAAANFGQFTTQPVTSIAGVAIPVVVTIFDAFGNTATGFNSPVTIFESGNPTNLPGNPQVFGTTVVNAVAGVVTYNNINMTDAVNGPYTLGVGFATSAQFNITPAAATNMVYTTAPAGGANLIAGAPIQLTIEARDNFGNVDTNYGGVVTITETSATQLFGNTANNAVAGIATFDNVTDNLTIQLAGNNYSLVATGAGVGTPGTTPLFNIVAAALSPGNSVVVFTNANGQSPVSPAEIVTFTVTERDAFNNLIGANTAATATFEVLAGSQNPSGAPVALTNAGGGVWTGQYTAAVGPGLDTLAILLDALAVSGSPFAINVQ